MTISVALAIRDPEFRAGRVFDATAVATFRESLKPMAYPWLRAAQVAGQRGFAFRTADQVADRSLDARTVLLVSYDWPPEATTLLAQGARPALLTSLEPPIIAWWLYTHLPRVSRAFPHVLLFEGARERTPAGTRFHPLRFPQPLREPLPGAPWAARRRLAMVNSNKAIVTSLARWFDRPREVSLKRWLASVRYPPVRDDGYQARLRLIQHFAARPDGFDLYGEGWHRRHQAVSPAQHAAAMRVYRGPAGDKLALLGGYRYALAVENTRFPGYVSEKLFDCFAAGCVPVYLGAPDIEQYVPADTFVDARQLANLPALERYLDTLPEPAWRARRDAGAAFLRSEGARAFSVDAFANEVLAILEQVASSLPEFRG